MSEMVSNQKLRADESFRAKERLGLIIPPEEDESGRVITPAIDFGTGFMPNGQSIRSFYDRGGRSTKEAEWLARFAVAKAAKQLLKFDEG